MLFDLRGRGRRRTVQVIYLGLALLMGGGLVLLGVGSNADGGLLNALTGGSKSPNTGAATDRRKAVEKRVQTHRGDPALWAELARARYLEAQAGQNVDQTTGGYTQSGQADLQAADRAWKMAEKLSGGTPDPNVATIMAQVYGPQGLRQPADAVAAQEVVATARNDVGSYLQLAGYAYAAGQQRKGELAGQKAVSLATKDQKEQIKAQVEGLKTKAAQQAAQGAQAGGASSGTTGP
jgi:hypothetical protein